MEFHKPSTTYANIMFGAVIINIFLCFAVVGLFFLIGIGVWQVLDAVIRLLSHDRRRVPYIITVGIYFAIWGGAAFSGYDISTAIVMGYVFVLPNFIAIWYCIITRNHALATVETEEKIQFLPDNILDSEMLSDKKTGY